MRNEDERSGWLFSYVDLEDRVGHDHPLRTIRAIVNEALARLAGEFYTLYSPTGRPRRTHACAQRNANKAH